MLLTYVHNYIANSMLISNAFALRDEPFKLDRQARLSLYSFAKKGEFLSSNAYCFAILAAVSQTDSPGKTASGRPDIDFPHSSRSDDVFAI